MPIPKKCDSKGQLSLDPSCANETFMDSIRRGLEQAKQKNFAEDPIGNKKMSWLEEFED